MAFDVISRGYLGGKEITEHSGRSKPPQDVHLDIVSKWVVELSVCQALKSVSVIQLSIMPPDSLGRLRPSRGHHSRLSTDELSARKMEYRRYQLKELLLCFSDAMNDSHRRQSQHHTTRQFQFDDNIRQEILERGLRCSGRLENRCMSLE